MKQYQIIVRFPGWCGVGIASLRAKNIDGIRATIREYIQEKISFVYYDEYDGHPIIVNPWLCPVIEIEELKPEE